MLWMVLACGEVENTEPATMPLVVEDHDCANDPQVILLPDALQIVTVWSLSSDESWVLPGSAGFRGEVRATSDTALLVECDTALRVVYIPK
jgi:hypothetical protein